jgi:3-oxoacyl-[acyl-carrier protein] reductase
VPPVIPGLPGPPAGRELLTGKVVVITAAAGTGIGSAAARRCLDEGAQVVVSDHHERRLAAVRDELAPAHGDRVYAQRCDVTDPGEVEGLVAAAVGHFGRIDVFINNAGLGGTGSVLELTDEDWLRVLDVTLNGTFRCTRAALGQMVRQGHGGAVVNSAALDVAQYGIRVNAVAPSLAAHPFLAKVTSEELLAELARGEAFGRAAEPWEVASVIAFLASDYASYLTGEVISVSSQHP